MDPQAKTRLTNLGKLVTVVGGQTADFQPPRTRTLLLDADLTQLDECRAFEAGSWVMMVDGVPVDWPVGGGNQYVDPLIAQVSIGTGGAAHELELDAVPGFAIQLPGICARAELVWDRLPTQTGVAPINRWIIPQNVRVRGTLHRGTVFPLGHRSYTMNRDMTIVPPFLVATEGPVPPYARSVMVYGDDRVPLGPAVPPYDATTLFTLHPGTPSVTPLARFNGAQLLTLKGLGARIPITGQMVRWAFASTATVERVVVDFEIAI
ncbi:MAG: hypothetical protein PHX83_14545 [Acidobacteriia bacterium]|nr:hypothetical protein [Terriglobia bacterium]